VRAVSTEDDPEEQASRRDQARAQLLAAAARLFAENSRVSVREIAQAAGVNHALVHYYFGSKAELKRATLDQVIHASAGRVQLSAASTPEEIVETMTSLYEHQEAALKLTMRSLLDGDRTLLEERDEFPIFERLVEIICPDDRERSQRAAATFLSSLVGSIVLRPWIVASAGLSNDDQRAYASAALVDLIREARRPR